MAWRSRPDWGRQKDRQKKKTCCYPDLHARAVPHSLPVMMFVTSYSTGKQAERQRPLDRESIVSVEEVHRWRRSNCLLESSSTLTTRSMTAMGMLQQLLIVLDLDVLLRVQLHVGRVIIVLLLLSKQWIEYCPKSPHLLRPTTNLKYSSGLHDLTVYRPNIFTELAFNDSP